MDIVQSILMGIVQGLSEFLPISSSAHLVFTSNFYKVFKGIELVHESNQEIFLDIMLHLGTLIAVLIFFRKEIFEILKALYTGLKTKNYTSREFKIGIYIILGTIITVLIAFPLNEVAGSLVFKPAFVGLLLIFTGILQRSKVKKAYREKRDYIKKLYFNSNCSGFSSNSRLFTFRINYCNGTFKRF